MNYSQLPYKFQFVWASTPDAPGIVTDPIPATAASPAASQQHGFPDQTAQNTSSGGVPPKIGDFNGMFKYISQWLQWYQGGGPIKWDATFSANANGYANGAIVGSNTIAGKFWRSTADGNLNNPDTGGANWTSFPPDAPAHGNAYFTVNSVWTCPAGIFQVWVEAWGGGGGSSGFDGSSGAGGGYGAAWITVVPGTTYNIVVGGGGAGNTAPGSGTAGGTSTFTAGIQVIGATGGVGGGPGPGPGGSGFQTNVANAILMTGEPGTDLTGTNPTYSIGSVTNAIGGAAPRGGMGGNFNAAAAGFPPTVPGGGAGANSAGAAIAGNGASGAVSVIW